ncbi:MAG: hypothetical protein V4563_15050 [Pseudomonadota bacterium]
MSLQNYIPTLPQIAKQTIVAIVSLVIASWIIAQFPQVKKFVNDNSLDSGG